MIPSEFDFQQFQAVIRKRLQLKSTQVMYIIFNNNRIYGAGNKLSFFNSFVIDKKMSYIYERERDIDGFLYVKYSAENYTG